MLVALPPAWRWAGAAGAQFDGARNAARSLLPEPRKKEKKEQRARESAKKNE